MMAENDLTNKKAYIKEIYESGRYTALWIQSVDRVFRVNMGEHLESATNVESIDDPRIGVEIPNSDTKEWMPDLLWDVIAYPSTVAFTPIGQEPDQPGVDTEDLDAFYEQLHETYAIPDDSPESRLVNAACEVVYNAWETLLRDNQWQWMSSRPNEPGGWHSLKDRKGYADIDLDTILKPHYEAYSKSRGHTCEIVDRPQPTFPKGNTLPPLPKVVGEQ